MAALTVDQLSAEFPYMDQKLSIVERTLEAKIPQIEQKVDEAHRVEQSCTNG